MLRSEVENAARALVGTPWRHQGRTEGTGLDCIGVLIRVVERTNYLEDTKQDVKLLEKYYKGHYALNPSDMILVDTLRLVMDEIEADELREGDVAVLKMPGIEFPKHLGVLVKGKREMMMIHTLGITSSLKVVEDSFGRWTKRVTHGFRFRNLED